MSLTPAEIRQLFNYPIQSPPPGIVPDFENSVSNGQVVYACAGVCYAIIFVAVGFKIAAKLMTTNKRFTWSDGMLVISVVGVVSWIALVIATMGGHGFGRHAWNVKLSFFTKDQLIFSQLLTTLYPLWILTIKLSVLLMYLELFHRKLWLRYWSYAAIAVFTVLHIFFVIIFAVNCRPRGGSDQVAYLAGYLTPECSTRRTYVIMQPIVNLVGDFFLMILPLPAIWGLNMDQRKKLKVSAMFLTGFCAIIAAIVALVYRLSLLDAQQDNTWKATYTWTASAFEMTAGIVVVCIPSVPAVMKKCMPILTSKSSFKWGSSSSKSTSATGSNSSTTKHLHWFTTSRSSAKQSSRFATVFKPSMQAQSYSDDSKGSWKNNHRYTGNTGGYHAEAISDQVSESSSRTEVGPGEIQRTTAYHVGVVPR